MKLPFAKKQKHPLANYLQDPVKYSKYKDGARPDGFTEKLRYEGPDAARKDHPFEADFDPYLLRDIQRERERRERMEVERHQYYALQPQSNLKRQKARYGSVDSRWTHMKRCQLCDHDNMCYEVPGRYRCQAVRYSRQCTGLYEVTQLDAARVRNMRPEDRVPYSSISDRYDHEALRAKNMARMKALKYATRA